MNGVESQTLTRASAGGDLERRVAQTRGLTSTVRCPVLREGRDSETCCHGSFDRAAGALNRRIYFIILPNDIGHGESSKPSDGLRMRFPRYSYDDMVRSQHEMLYALCIISYRQNSAIFVAVGGVVHAATDQ
jgi:pimeloyl-ACP methyl ester carboxylesterase